ncbi:MAG: ATP-dependent helicase RecG [Acidobacteriota bacterium]|nr:ATP-dependent helicase RecG [Acidobacteriota bacterium]
MLNSISELLNKIRLGEDSYLELKEMRFSGEKISGPGRDDFADELAAFANSHGGVCVLGVTDKPREILGIPLDRLDGVESFVRAICIDSIRPPLTPTIERLLLPSTAGEEFPVIKIEIHRSLFVHQSPGGYFHRVGSSKRQMPPDYLARLFQQRSQARLIRFDEQVIPQANLDDLKENLWQRFTSHRTLGPREDMLAKLGMTRKDEDGVIRPTVAGVLMGTEDPRNWLPNAYIQAVAYRGTEIRTDNDAIYQLDAEDLTGPLDAQVMAACTFVRKNMRIGARKREGRMDIPQYDMVAVFEAVVNAAAHRDYSVYGSKIRLRMFDDRLELYSPGTIPNTMTVDSLPYRQSARNETITSLLARCPVPARDNLLLSHRTYMMDKRGEGVPIILQRSQELSGQAPEYRLIDDAELLLTIYAAGSDKKIEIKNEK